MDNQDLPPDDATLDDDRYDQDRYDQEGPALFGTEPEPVAPEPAEPEPASAPEPTKRSRKKAPAAKAAAAAPGAVEPTVPAAETAAAGPTVPAPADSGSAVAEPAAPTPAEPARPAPRPAEDLALYRRYRPDTFDDVIGQEHVTEPLKRALRNNKVNHAYLFSGPRGCGKTSCARILARCLNCEQGPTPTPCGVCQSCRDLATGGPGSIDVIELDAATHGLVDDARDLRERAFFAPVQSRYKIYIIDEAHMVTPQGFNALLKLVEEPPPHVKFIFATTEPEKVIGTIRSRTHHYPFRLVPPRVLGAYLATLCEKEGVHVDDGVLPLVVRAGAGSVRDALSVLDQLLGAADEGRVEYAAAAALLGYTPETLLDEIMEAFGARNGEGVFATVDRVIEIGQDPRRFSADLLQRLRDLIIVAQVPDAVASGLIDVSADQGERLAAQAAALGAGALTRAAEVVSAGLVAMRGTTAPRLHLELMCSRVLLDDADERSLVGRLDRLERRLAGAPGGAAPAADRGRSADQVPVDRPAGSRGRPVIAATRPDAAQPPAQQRPVEQQRPSEQQRAPEQQRWPEQRPSESQRPVESQRAVEQQRPVAQQRPSEQPAVSRPQPRSAAEAPQAAQPSPATSDGLSPLARVRQQWPTILERVQGHSRVTHSLLSRNAEVVDVTGTTVTLGLATAGLRDSFLHGNHVATLTAALREVFHADLTVQAVVGGPGSGPAPSAMAAPPSPPPSAPARPHERPAPVSHPRPDPWEPPEDDVPDDEVSADDQDLDDGVSATALLADVLGAEPIDEQTDDD